MKQLAAALPASALTATQPEKNSPTCSDGSAMVGSSALTPSQQKNLQPEEVQDIHSKLRTLKPWLIEPADQKAVQSALHALDLSLIPATYEQAGYWITRALAHFPRRDSSQDGVIISDLAGAIVSENVSLMAVYHVCDELWQQTSKDEPWFPATGHVLREMIDRTNIYRSQRDRLANPRPALPVRKRETIRKQPDPNDPLTPIYGKYWPTMDRLDRSVLIEEAKKHPKHLRALLFSLWKMPEETQAKFEEGFARQKLDAASVSRNIDRSVLNPDAERSTW